MTAVFLDKVIGFVDKRLVLTSLLPSAAFWVAVATLTGGQIGWTRVRKWWTHLDTGTHLLLTVVAVALLVLFALLLSAQEGLILRFYEGYWGRRIPGRWLSAFGVRRQQEKVARLDLNDDSQFEYRYRNFPRLAGDVMPTRLGNILRASERYPADEERYSMDAVFFWPRLIAVVPGSVRANLSDARASLALLLNVCTLSIVLAVGAIVALAVIGLVAAFWATAGGAALLAGLTYSSALGPARVYAELVRSVFDLYRGDLLKRLGFGMPDSLADERKLWKNLGEQLYRRAATETAVLDAARKRANATAVATAAGEQTTSDGSVAAESATGQPD